MPPHDCENDFEIFIRKDDGLFVKFDGIENMKLLDIDGKYSTEEILSWPQVSYMEMKLSGRSARRFRKSIYAALNNMRRVKRTLKRRKEKERRARLKGAV